MIEGERTFEPIGVTYLAFSQRIERKRKKGTPTVFLSHWSGGSIKTYKTVKNAIRYSSLWPVGDPNYREGLVVIFRPDDLEPVNIAPAERIEWLKQQVEKWWGRLLLDSGLHDDERAVVCEDFMLKLGNLMKRYERGETVLSTDGVPSGDRL